MNNQDGISSSFRIWKRQPLRPPDMENFEATNHKKIILLLIVSVLYAAALSFVLSNQPIVLVKSDYFARWYATDKLLTDHRSLYDLQNGVEVVAQNPSPFDPLLAGFYYPAYLIFLILPLVWIPYPLAHFIWLILIQLFLILAIYLVYHEIDWPETVNRFTLFLFLSLIFIPSMQNTIWGQYNTIAVISLAGAYLYLRRKSYLLAGLLATGMTFKPQQMLLTLFFLLLWSLFKKERWKFLLGFGTGMLALWFCANLLEPNWVGGFLAGLLAYSSDIQPTPVLQIPFFPQWATWLLGAVISIWLFYRNRASSAESVAFAGCLVLSLGIWWLFVPVIGMMHMVALPVAILLLLAAYKKLASRLYTFGLAAFLALYGLGLLGFLYGLSAPELYGLHIQLSEMAYKNVAVVLVVVLALPLCFSRKPI